MNLEIPLVCAIATNASLEKYSDYIPIDLSNIIPTYKEWNRALINLLKKEPYYSNMGDLGKIILNNKKAQKLGSPELAIKFAQAYTFCSEKIENLQWKKNIEFIDVGCGFSPLSIILKKEFNNLDLYIWDFSEISKIFLDASNALGVDIKERTAIETTKYKLKTRSHFDLTSSMACFPYISPEGQLKRLNLIQKASSHFFIEIYDNSMPIPKQKNIKRFTNQNDPRIGLKAEELNNAIRSKDITEINSLQKILNDWYGNDFSKLPKKMLDSMLLDNSLFISR